MLKASAVEPQKAKPETSELQHKFVVETPLLCRVRSNAFDENKGK